MCTRSRYLFIVVISLLVHQSCSSMQFGRVARPPKATTPARPTKVTAPPRRTVTQPKSWRQRIREFVTGRKETPTIEEAPPMTEKSISRTQLTEFKEKPSQSPSMVSSRKESTPQISWYRSFINKFFGSAEPPIKQTPAVSTHATVKQTIEHKAKDEVERQIAEQKKIDAFKAAMIEAPSLSYLGIYDIRDIDSINKIEQLVEKNPGYINIPIQFKAGFRRKGTPRHAVTILHELLRRLVEGEYTDLKNWLISEASLKHRNHNIWWAEIALVKKVISLGGNLGDTPQEALFEILKRTALIQELLPTVYNKYFKNDINILLKQIADLHHLNYEILDGDAHDAVAPYIFKIKTQKTQAYNALKDLLGMKEVPTEWEPIRDALFERQLIHKPLKEGELIKDYVKTKYAEKDLGSGLVIDKEAVKILKNFKYYHEDDQKYKEVNKTIDQLFGQTYSGGEFRKNIDWTYSESPKLLNAPPKLLEAPLLEEYRTLGVDPKASWEKIVMSYKQLLEENDPTFENNPAKRQKKLEMSEKVQHAFEAVEADRMERINRKFEELDVQERARYLSEREEL
jgi:hypothetical protein